jgi:hypothetical protein
MRPEAASAAMVTMNEDWNQSSLLPSSSMVCSEPSPIARSASASQSTLPRSRSSPSRGRAARVIITARIPSGTLMKKIQRQPMLVTMVPPRVGPITGPAMTIAPKKPWAAACSSRGKVSNRIAWALASRPPPMRPWSTRATISIGREVETPHRIDAAVKPTREKTK